MKNLGAQLHSLTYSNFKSIENWVHRKSVEVVKYKITYLSAALKLMMKRSTPIECNYAKLCSLVCKYFASLPEQKGVLFEGDAENDA